jgi:hypothetical protein
MRVLPAAISLRAQAVATDGGRVYELAEVDVQPRPLSVRDLQRAMECGDPTALRDRGASGPVLRFAPARLAAGLVDAWMDFPLRRSVPRH